MVRFSLCLVILLAGCTSGEKKDRNSSPSPGIIVLAPAEFKSQLSGTSDAVLLDVRKPEEIPEGIISGADNIDFTAPDFTNKIAGLDKNKPYFVYCKSGKRSGDAVLQMKELGFKNLYTLDGGLNNWEDQGLEIVKP